MKFKELVMAAYEERNLLLEEIKRSVLENAGFGDNVYTCHLLDHNIDYVVDFFEKEGFCVTKEGNLITIHWGD